jgi:hypothetical protein
MYSIYSTVLYVCHIGYLLLLFIILGDKKNDKENMIKSIERHQYTTHIHATEIQIKIN